ncbi:MAG: rhomboid family intramembrane serine protease [Hyphomicrobiaceae bacterium]
MFPIGDDNTARRSLPVVTYALIAANVLFFLVELSGGQAFIQQWAFIPRRFTDDPAGAAPTIFTAMFMHAGWLHLGGNMLYLWIFGDNIEDRFGSAKFLIFYLVCGLAATFAQYYVSPGSRIPNVGASGAIAGILGSYLLLFPHARVRVLLYNRIVHMPAIAVLGFWIVLQIFAGAGALFATAQSEDVGGVAYMAHVGGFVAGFLLTLLLRSTEPREGR